MIYQEEIKRYEFGVIWVFLWIFIFLLVLMRNFTVLIYIFKYSYTYKNYYFNHVINHVKNNLNVSYCNYRDKINSQTLLFYILRQSCNVLIIILFDILRRLDME